MFLKISKILLILILPFVLFLGVLSLVGFDEGFYQQKFSEYKVEKDAKNAVELHKKIINFITSKNNSAPNELNEKEQQHLFDVRNLIRISKIIFYVFVLLFVLLIIASAFMLKVNNYIVNFVGKVLLFGGLLTVVLAALLFFFISSDFSSAFESFHKLLFENGTYIFDPDKDTIIRLYPEIRTTYCKGLRIFSNLLAKLSMNFTPI